MEAVESKKQKWSPFFKLMAKSKVPWHWYIIVLVMTVGNSVLYLKVPQLSGDIMSGNIMDRKTVVTYIAVSLFTAVAMFPIMIFGNWVNLKTDRNIQNSVWSKFVKIPVPFFNRLNPSALISRVTNDTTYVSLAIQAVFTAITVLTNIILMYKSMSRMDSKLSAMLLLVVPYIVAVAMLSGRFNFKAQKKIQGVYSSFTFFLAERLSNLKLIKSSGTEEIEEQDGNELIEKQYKADMYMAKVNLITKPFTSLISVFCQGIILIYGGYLINKNVIDIGQLITAYMFMQILPALLLNSIIGYQTIKQAQGATSNVAEILETENEILKRKRSFSLPDDDIKFENVSFSYDKEKVLSNLNLIIPKGKVTAIVGPSGSGKTTILNLLERFYIPNSGHIKFGSVPIEDIHVDEWRDTIGYVPQRSPLLVGSIWDNIVYGIHREAKEDEVIRAAKLANAYDFISKLPEGFETNVGELGSKLSGGERQRIAIARMIIKDPDYLLLDEATCNLDACNEYEVQKALNNLMKDKTTIVVAHNIKTIKNADNIIVLEKGQIQGVGQHEELYKNNALYRKYFDLQFN